ncbi:hypothetical protein JTB14_013596 [Gonioctena quinquepunctata]|nr:hypothetical protein JTB14_013596 [Gonioctena quinquepunctata]
MIQAKVPDVSTFLLSNKRIIHVKDMDEITDIEDIREAIAKSIPAKPEDILRPTTMSKQNATVVLHEPDAVKLVSLGKMKIEWLDCKVLKKQGAKMLQIMGIWARKSAMQRTRQKQ